MKRFGLFLLVATLGIAGALTFYLNRTTRVNSVEAPGFRPVRVPDLAIRYAPLLTRGGPHGDPERLYYRAARDSAGALHIAYHYVWAGESNPTKGFLPWLNRTLYTGGLALQKSMFGKGDVELVYVKVDPKGRRIIFIEYETPEGYNPRAFGVKHKTVRQQSPEYPLTLEVISWNHLFRMLTPKAAAGRPLLMIKPEYFTPALWSEYQMFKPHESFLRRSRAHRPFERRAASGKSSTQ